nr:MAG TPA: LONG TAIL FIBER PROTEIN [Caudoviricetes sp.]
MANLPEESKYDEGVYQIERKDRVVGGPDGVSNKGARNLANRTRWLKDQITRLFSEKADKNAPSFTGQASFDGGANFSGVSDVTGPRPPDADDSFRFATTSWVRRVMLPKTHAGSRGTAAHAEATTTEAGFMSPADKAKLNGIATGAQANAVTSVAGHTGAVKLSVSDISGAAPLDRPSIQKASFTGDSNIGGAPAIKSTGLVDLRGGMALAEHPVRSPEVLLDIRRGNERMGPDPSYQRQIATVGWVEENAVRSINGKKGEISKLAVSDVEGAAPLNAPSFRGTVEFANHVNFRGGVAFHDQSYGVQVSSPPAGDNSAMVPNTSWVKQNTVASINGKKGDIGKLAVADVDGAAPLNSPTFTGTITVRGQTDFANGVRVTCNTPPHADDSFHVANTSWVRAAMAHIASSAGFMHRLNGAWGVLKFPSWLGGGMIQWMEASSTETTYNRKDWPIAFPRDVSGLFITPRNGHAWTVAASPEGPRTVVWECPNARNGRNCSVMILAFGW